MRPAVNAREERRGIRHRRIRARVSGTTERPRLAVYRSLNHIYAQLIDDVAGRTLVSAATTLKEVRDKVKHGGNKKAAAVVGEIIAQKAAEKGIKQVCFDRGGFKYHGCVAMVAEAARKAGLQL